MSSLKAWVARTLPACVLLAPTWLGCAWAHPGIREINGGGGKPRILGRPGNGVLVAAGLISIPGRTRDLLLHDVDERGTLRSSWRISTGSWLDVTSLCATADGGALMAFSSARDTHLVRLTADLSASWAVTLQGSAGVIGYISSVSPAANSGFWALAQTPFGAADPGALVIRLREDGSVEWARRVSLPDQASGSRSSIVAAADGGAVALTGWSSSAPHAYLVKVGADGTPEWERTVESARTDRPMGVASLADGTILTGIVTGSFPPYSQPMLVRFGLDGTMLGTPRTWIGFIDGQMNALDGLLQASPDGAATIVDATFVTAGAAVNAWRVGSTGDVEWSGIHALAHSGTLVGAFSAIADDAGIWFLAGSPEGETPVHLYRLDRWGRVGDTCPPSPLPLTPYDQTSPFLVGQQPWRPETIDTVRFRIEVLVESAVTMDITCDGWRPSLPDEVSPPGAAQPLRVWAGGRLTWEAPALSHSTSIELFRANLAAIRSGPLDCLIRDLLTPIAIDGEACPPNGAWCYLVRGVNSDGAGTLGRASTGAERLPGAACP